MIPTWEMSISSKTKYKKDCRNLIINRSMALRLFLDRYEACPRDICPYDFGLESWHVPGQTPGTFTRWIEHETRCKVIVVYKVVQLSTCPVVNKLAFRSDNNLRCSYSLSELYGIIPMLKRIGAEMDRLQAQYGLENLSMDGWLEEPVLFDPSSRIMVDTFTDPRKQGYDELVLVGFVVER